MAIATTYVATGHPAATAAGGLATAYVATVSLVDTVIVVGLVLIFLLAHGERPREVLVGSRPLMPEAAAGLLLIPAAIAIAAAVMLTTQHFAPWLHTVEHNPLQDVLQSRRDAWLFVFVVIFAGGVREEIQRAFILHRFGEWLGGTTIGLIVTSVAFGVGHLPQGEDAVIATGLLGLLWGAVYLRRRSTVAPMVSHAGFDLLQIAQFVVGR